MRSAFHSLQFRLISGFAVVLGLSLLGVSAYTGYAANRHANRFEALADDARDARLQQVLSGHFPRSPNPTGLQTALEDAASLYGGRIIVTDPDGQVIADSERANPRPPAYPSRRPRGFSLTSDGGTVATVSLVRSDLPNGSPPGPAASAIARAVNRSLLLTGLAAAAGGLLLVSLVSRQVLGPVTMLTSAARRLGQGDLAQRVPTSGRDEIAELGRTFNLMAADLQHAEKRRQDMVADVAHELRTPLSNIQGYLEAMEDGLLRPEGGALDAVRAQTLHLARIVEDLRLVASADAGKLTLERRPTDLDELLRSSVEAIRPRAAAVEVEIILSIAEVLPTVELDQTRIAQVVGNLLENAVRYSPAGAPVTVTGEVVGGVAARVGVADMGEGMTDDEVRQIFDRFYRADPSRSRGTGGAGLGLTIAKQLVEAHGGTIRAESIRGSGSRFVFEIPVAAPPPHRV